MSVTTSFPGVYIVETPGGTRTVTGVATSITAFVGSALRGPVDEPVPIASFADFERTFGGLWRTSGLGYAVRDFFTGGGGAALVVRVVHPVDPDAPDDPDGATTATVDAGGLSLTATGPGQWADVLQVEVSHPPEDDDDAEAVAAAQGVTAADLFHLVVREGSDEDAPSETYVNVTVATDRERRRQLRLHVLEAVADRLAVAGRFGLAFDAGLAALQTDGLRESAHRTLIRTHLAEGNVVEARRAFEHCREVLARDVGVEPSAATRSLVPLLGGRPPVPAVAGSA